MVPQDQKVGWTGLQHADRSFVDYTESFGNEVKIWSQDDTYEWYVPFKNWFTRKLLKQYSHQSGRLMPHLQAQDITQNICPSLIQLRCKRNSWHIADDISECISIHVALKLTPKDLVDNNSAPVLLRAWCSSSLIHICVTSSQCVDGHVEWSKAFPYGASGQKLE